MNKKILLISIILIVLCSLSVVSASEINGTDDSVGVDSDVLSAPSSVVGTSEINGTDDSVGVDNEVNIYFYTAENNVYAIQGVPEPIGFAKLNESISIMSSI